VSAVSAVETEGWIGDLMALIDAHLLPLLLGCSTRGLRGWRVTSEAATVATASFVASRQMLTSRSELLELEPYFGSLPLETTTSEAVASCLWATSVQTSSERATSATCCVSITVAAPGKGEDCEAFASITEGIATSAIAASARHRILARTLKFHQTYALKPFRYPVHCSRIPPEPIPPAPTVLEPTVPEPTVVAITLGASH